MKTMIKAAVLIAFTVFFASCDLIVFENPPFVITKPVFETSGKSFYYTYAGISFNFLNTSGKTVDHITVSFSLFDTKTQGNPFMGGNVFEITKTEKVLPNVNREFILPMDSYLYVVPSEPLLIDFFHISEIRYEDGSFWQDRNGVFYVRNTK